MSDGMSVTPSSAPRSKRKPQEVAVYPTLKRVQTGTKQKCLGGRKITIKANGQYSVVTGKVSTTAGSPPSTAVAGTSTSMLSPYHERPPAKSKSSTGGPKRAGQYSLDEFRSPEGSEEEDDQADEDYEEEGDSGAMWSRTSAGTSWGKDERGEYHNSLSLVLFALTRYAFLQLKHRWKSLSSCSRISSRPKTPMDQSLTRLIHYRWTTSSRHLLMLQSIFYLHHCCLNQPCESFSNSPRSSLDQPHTCHTLPHPSLNTGHRLQLQRR